MKYYIIYVTLVLAGAALLSMKRPLLASPLFHRATFVLVAATMGIFLWLVTIPAANYDDFTTAYHVAGKLIITNPSDLYHFKHRGFVNLPVVALLFVPLADLEQNSAILIAIALSFVAIVASCLLLLNLNLTRGRTWPLIFGLFVASGPLFLSIRAGNLTHMLMPLLIAILVLHRRNGLLAGSLSALLAVIKLPFLLLGIYYVFRKRWQLASGFWLAIIGVFAVSMLMFGPSLHSDWYYEVIQQHAGTAVGAYGNQSINGFLAHLLPENDLYYFGETVQGSRFRAAQLLLVAGIVVPTAWLLFRSGAPATDRDFMIEFSIVLSVSILISPVSWIHYYSLLLVPMCLLLGECVFADRPNPSRLERWNTMLILLATALLSLPVVHTLPDAVIPPIPFVELLVRRVLVSHYFFGGLLFLCFLLVARFRSTIAQSNREAESPAIVR